MYLGLDLGGTHIDGALLDGAFKVKRTVKLPTVAEDLGSSLRAVLAELLRSEEPAAVERLVISSTLGLNALITGQGDRVGVLLTGGPGLPPPPLPPGALGRVLAAGLDHCGEPVTSLDEAQARAAVASLAAEGSSAWVAASKFGPKNTVFEERLAEIISELEPRQPLTRASRLAGRLNFPRRLNTAVFNSSLINIFQNFIKAATEAVASMGLSCPLDFLSADGSALSAAEAMEKPILAAAAGPAAGLLGLWSLAGLKGDALMLDIGGTSTDIAVMADGEPLMTAEGLTIAGRPTLVRSFLSHSIALGGDSRLSVLDGRVRLGPQRQGLALALVPEDLGRRDPTFTDALNILGLCQLGELDISRRALEALGAGRPELVAEAALNEAVRLIGLGLQELLKRVNSRPVYTVNELRFSRSLRPQRGALLGGPAEALAEPLSRRLALDLKPSPLAAVANAVGAARTRPCPTAELYADTAQGFMSIPALGLSRPIGRDYRQSQAEADILQALGEIISRSPHSGPARVVEAESFNQLSGWGRADRIIRVRAQAAPGYLGGQDE